MMPRQTRLPDGQVGNELATACKGKHLVILPVPQAGPEVRTERFQTITVPAVRQAGCASCTSPLGNTPMLCLPQSPQVLCNLPCSVARTVIGGISKTWRASWPSAPLGGPWPQRPHCTISWTTMASGVSTILSLLPLWPFYPPWGLLDPARRPLVFPKGSREGGTLLLPLFFGFSYLARRSLKMAFSFCRATMIASVSFLKRANSSLSCKRSCLSVKVNCFHKDLPVRQAGPKQEHGIQINIHFFLKNYWANG